MESRQLSAPRPACVAWASPRTYTCQLTMKECELQRILIFIGGEAGHKIASQKESTPMRCYLASDQNRARFWLFAGNHVEPEEEIRNCTFFHARDSYLP